MGRSKAPFWEHVEKLENKRYLCIYCGHEFAGSISITRIKYHLSGIRNRDTEICPEVPEDVQEKAYQAFEASNKKTKNMPSSNDAKENETIPASLPSSSNGLHQSITSKVRKKDNSEVDEQLAKFIILKKYETFDAIKDPFFVDFLKRVAEFGPSYKLPKFSTLASQMFPKIEQEVGKYIENIEKSMFSTGYTVMFNHFAYPMFDIFVCTLEGAMCIAEVEHLKDEKDVAEIKCLNSFDHPIQFIITNELQNHFEKARDDSDGESYKSIKDVLIEKYPMAYVTGCVAEEIQSLLKTIYQKVSWVWKTFHLAFVIVKYLYEHQIDLSLGIEQLRSKNYGFDGFHKIASQFLMLTSILKVERELQALQLSIPSPSSEPKEQLALTKEVAKVVDYAIHSKDFWTRGKELEQLLQPLFRVLRLVDGNGPTSGYLYEAMRRAENAIMQKCGRNQVHYEMIWEIFKSKRSDIIHPIHAAAAFLNPAYMLSQQFRVDNEMEGGINYISEHLIPADSKEVFIEQVQLYRMEDPKLFTATSVRLLETCHPGIWWKNFGGPLAMLNKYANRILSQPCSSSLCKVDHWRFTPNNDDDDDDFHDFSDDLKFKINLTMMEKFSMLGLEPINLHEIPGLPEYDRENRTTAFDNEFEGQWPLEDYQGLLTIDDPTPDSVLPWI